jgi:hypothetical protein
MTNLHNYSNIVEYTERNKNISYSSITYNTPNQPLESSMLKTRVLISEVYRPDKISLRLYDNPLSSWILDEANNFYNGFSDYYYDREIYYPSLEALELMGISVIRDI